jgi:hypothetical protein
LTTRLAQAEGDYARMARSELGDLVQNEISSDAV